VKLLRKKLLGAKNKQSIPTQYRGKQGKGENREAKRNDQKASSRYGRMTKKELAWKEGSEKVGGGIKRDTYNERRHGGNIKKPGKRKEI